MRGSAMSCEPLVFLPDRAVFRMPELAARTAGCVPSMLCEVLYTEAWGRILLCMGRNGDLYTLLWKLHVLCTS